MLLQNGVVTSSSKTALYRVLPPARVPLYIGQ